MNSIRRLLLALVLIAGFGPALAQAPAPVPALPDAERRTTYVISASTCACNVNFAVYGDGTDYGNWLEVWVNGVQQIGGWTFTSPSGPITNLARPISDGIITFNVAQTGTVQIIGARRPRRVSQFSESAGVSARGLNQAITDIVAQNRENWDKTNDVTGRALLGIPGEVMPALPPAATRANNFLGFNSTGAPVVLPGGAGSGNVTSSGASTTGHLAVFTDATGRAIGDGGAVPNLTQRGYLSGLTLSNDPVTPNTLINIAAGVATSDDTTTLMNFPSAFVKNMNSVWGVGSGNGCADGASSYTTLQSSTSYHLFLIERLDTSVVDILCSKSATAPTYPSGSYTVKRRIGSVVTDGSANIKLFVQSGFDFLWKVQTNDVLSNNPGTALQTATLTLPTGIQVKANITFYLQSADSTPARRCALITSPDQTQSTPAAGTLSSSCAGISSPSTAGINVGQHRVRTNTSGQFYWQLDSVQIGGTPNVTVYVDTIGWEDNL